MILTIKILKCGGKRALAHERLDKEKRSELLESSPQTGTGLLESSPRSKAIEGGRSELLESSPQTGTGQLESSPRSSPPTRMVEALPCRGPYTPAPWLWRSRVLQPGWLGCPPVPGGGSPRAGAVCAGLWWRFSQSGRRGASTVTRSVSACSNRAVCRASVKTSSRRTWAVSLVIAPP